MDLNGVIDLRSRPLPSDLSHILITFTNSLYNYQHTTMSSTSNSFYKTLAEFYNDRPYKTLKNKEDNLMSGGLTPGISMITWTDFSLQILALQ